MGICDRINYNLAWKRVKEDLRTICFVDHPFEISLIDFDLKNWLNNLKRSLEDDSYNPSKTRIIDIPKADWHLRPGGIMAVKDMVVYSGLILDIIKKIDEGTGDEIKKRKFQHIIKKDQSGKDWFEFELNGWNQFMEQSLKLIDDGFKFLLVTDISAFFENIDIDRLISDLESFGIPEDNKKLLKKCLYRWAEPRGRGLIQGVKPSHILSDLYLNSIEKRLINENINYLRYVDDLRIFCKDEKEAVKALHILTKLYRQKGLNLQTAKSEIIYNEDAKDHIRGVALVISKLNKKIVNELKGLYDIENPYGTPKEIRRLVKQKRSKISLQILIDLFKKYFLSKEKVEFNKSLFHFFINRLGALKSSIAMDYCLELLLLKPEETPFIMDYFDDLESEHLNIARRLCMYMEDDSIMYKYQYFKFLSWIYKNSIKDGNILNTYRQLIKKSFELDNIKDICILYIGKYGDLEDLDYIETLYELSNNPIRTATIIYSLRRLPKSRRNRVYGRAKGDNHEVSLAIELACNS